jgi:2-C-methyl-D-erythritol 4-phosphate cytidylyltransferase
MGSDVPKQYLSINEKPVIYYSLKVMEESDIDEVILVVGKDDMDYCREQIVEKYHFQKIKLIIEGGSERYLSVYNGLCAIDNIDYVLIHDGARPLIDKKLIARTIEQVKKHQACVVGMPVKDTIKIADENGMVESTPVRDKVWMIQTPQAFNYLLIRNAYDTLMKKMISSVTDDAMVLEQIGGYSIKLIEGSYENIKITTPEDIQLAQLFLSKKSNL